MSIVILLHTLGLSMGKYCYTINVIKGLFCIMEKCEDGQAYNVVNEDNNMTIRDISELVAIGLDDGKIRIDYINLESSLMLSYAP